MRRHERHVVRQTARYLRLRQIARFPLQVREDLTPRRGWTVARQVFAHQLLIVAVLIVVASPAVDRPLRTRGPSLRTQPFARAAERPR